MYVIHAPIGANVAGQGAIYLLADAVAAEVSCSPRPRIALETRPVGPGLLQVTVSAGTNPGSAQNELRSLQFGTPTNARVIVGGVAHDLAFTHTLVPPASSLTFTVQRDRAGAMLARLTVTDACSSPWPTFVGAGPSMP